MRPSRGFLFLGAMLGILLPFADGLAHGAAGFLRTFQRDEQIWTTAGRLLFLLIFGATSLFPAARTSIGWTIAAMILYGAAAGGYFLSVFTYREPLFGGSLHGYKIFVPLLPIAGVFHLITLTRDLPWELRAFWARVHLSGLIFLSGAIHAHQSPELIGGWVATAAAVFLLVGETLARREDAFGEDATS